MVVYLVIIKTIIQGVKNKFFRPHAIVVSEKFKFPIIPNFTPDTNQ